MKRLPVIIIRVFISHRAAHQLISVFVNPLTVTQLIVYIYLYSVKPPGAM